MRYVYHNVIQDQRGTAVVGASITVTLAGGSTAASIYTAFTGGTVDADGVIVSGTDGTFTFYVDEDDYPHNQQFRIVWSKTDHTSETWDYIQIFPDSRRTAITDSTADQGDSAVVGTIAWHIADVAGDPVVINLLYDTYKIVTKITIAVNNVKIIGDPGPRPIITNSIAGGASDCIEFTTSDPDGAAVFGSGCGIENVVITAATTQTAGAALKVVKHNGFNIERVSTLEHPFGFDLYGIRGLMANKFYLYGTTGESLVDEGALLRIGPQLNDDASYSVPWYSFFSDFVIGGNYQVDYGIEINASDGVHFSNGNVSSAYDSNLQLEADIGGTTNVVGVFFDNVYFDGVNSVTGSLFGVTFKEDNGTIAAIEFNNSLFANYQNDGIRILEDSTTTVNITGSRFSTIGAAAVTINSTGAKVIINGNHFKNCRFDADSGGVITPANSSVTTITNNQFSNTAAVAAWGIIWSGTHNQGVCSNNSFENFSDGDVGYSATFNDEYKQFGNTTDAAAGIGEVGGRNLSMTLADEATPSIVTSGIRYKIVITGGTTTITDFDDGVNLHKLLVLAEHSVTITDGTNIYLDGSANWAMTSGDTLSMIQKADGKWYEQSRGNNGA